MSDPARHTNRLVAETSPYLLQHAHNPVDWRPWSEDALALARSEGKPILLSIGYSACHWCHVMAHESFEDEATAALMNAYFINIKVDREERPDLDRIYQTAHWLIAKRGGGWPLTMFLDPEDHAPFFGGTYFPPESRHGLPAFRDLLTRGAEVFRERRADLREQNVSLLEYMRGMDADAPASGTLDDSPIETALRALEQSFEPRFGGFGRAPKFPHASNLELLLRDQVRKPDAKRRRVLLHTLTRMAEGGLFDHLGGGFCRYSVDDQWMIPHFEKMLYDNGPLLALYAEAAAAFDEPLYRRTVLAMGEWLIREMRAPEGGFYSALDADSEGEEGKFYVWTREEACALLADDEYRVFAARFGLDREANFEGHWHLHGHRSEEETAAQLGVEVATIRAWLESSRAKLFAARAQRIHPGRDDKILASWNALAIRGLAIAARLLGQPQFLTAAGAALDFIRTRMMPEGRLLATCKDGRAHLAAYLDDHAFLLDACLALLEARWCAEDLALAITLADTLLERFEDREHGGFYFTAHDHERLIHRPRPFADESLPAGNGIAARALARLGHLIGETRYLDAAERVLKAAWPTLTQQAHAHASLLIALDEYLAPPQLIILRGDARQLPLWQAACGRGYAPRRMTLAVPSDASELPGLLAQRRPQGAAVAYICTGHVCRTPVTALDALPAALAD
jgi:hypothetical protein